MATRMAEFEKVSFEQFSADLEGNFPDIAKDKHREIYDSIQLPKRATSGSAGYDFCIPIDLKELNPNETVTIPTGIRSKIEEGWVLMCCP